MWVTLSSGEQALRLIEWNAAEYLHRFFQLFSVRNYSLIVALELIIVDAIEVLPKVSLVEVLLEVVDQKLKVGGVKMLE